MHMIDSVVLKLNKEQYKISNRDFFDGRNTKQVDGRFSTGSAFVGKFKNQKKKQGNYFPMVQISESTNRNDIGEKEKIESLEIQVSLPKLLHQTNLWEIDTTDEDEIYDTLKKHLTEIKVQTSIIDLKSAFLRKVDFSKSFVVPSYFGSATQMIKRLSGFDYKSSSDFRLNYYDNNDQGVSLKFLNKSQGYVIYSKIGEIVSNGYTEIEQQIIKAVGQEIFPDATIRFELSLQHKQNMDTLLRRLTNTKQKNFTLHDIMKNKDISKQALLETFNKVFNSTNEGLLTLSEMQENRFENLMVGKKFCFEKRALMHQLVNMTTKIGEKCLWEQLKMEWSGGSYARKKKELKNTLEELGELQGELPTLVGFLRNEHEKFRILKP